MLLMKIALTPFMGGWDLDKISVAFVLTVHGLGLDSGL
jgi:hypothetical protein